MSRKKLTLSELNLKKIGGRFAFIRLKAGEGQDILSKNIGISKGNLSEIENDKHNPSYIPIIRIIEKYSVNPIWLLFGDGDPYIDKEGISEDDPFKEMLIMTREILASETDYSASLAANIKAFHHAIATEKKLSNHEERLALLEKKIKEEEEEVPFPDVATRN